MIYSIRLVKHGRYHSGSVAWNRLISFLFISSGTMDIVAFIYWLNREPNIEDVVLLASSYVMWIMAILALYFQAMEIGDAMWR